jgi:hypothetical protein
MAGERMAEGIPEFRLGRAVRQQVRRGLESQQQTVSGVCAIA